MKVYTDGSCHGNPGKGGWALWCPENGLVKTGGHASTTNNRMEMTAIIEAMKTPGVTEIVTDSMYCMQGCNNWIFSWIKKGWKTASGKPVKNIDLWKQVEELNPSKFKITWVKAHAGNPDNEKVDKLANLEIEKLP